MEFSPQRKRLAQLFFGALDRLKEVCAAERYTVCPKALKIYTLPDYLVMGEVPPRSSSGSTPSIRSDKRENSSGCVANAERQSWRSCAASGSEELVGRSAALLEVARVRLRGDLFYDGSCTRPACKELARGGQAGAPLR